jgi:phosphatidylglycerophosphate synthase
MIEEYKRSLKMPEVEEIFDLILFRLAGFFLVKQIYGFPITPNQISLLSMILGMLAAWYFFVGTSAALVCGGLLLALSNIFDCADGQLARLQQSGTLLGRVIDGVADYVVGIAVFLGIGFSISSSEWLMVILAGISSAVHAMFFDHYQSEFISIARMDKSFLQMEIEQFTKEVQKMKVQQRDGIKVFFLTFYLKYLGLQKLFSTKSDVVRYDPEIYRKENFITVRFWSFLGPTTNRTILVLCAMIGWVDIYLWIVLIPGNLWLIFCYLLQRKVHLKLRTV